MEKKETIEVINSGNPSQMELERLKAKRKERYEDQKREYWGKNKNPNKKIMITIIILIFAFYIALFALKVAGVLSSSLTAVLGLPVLVAVIIVYLVYTKKKSDQ